MAAAPGTSAPIATTGVVTGMRGGVSYKLGQEIGQGGNGIVYAISRRPELVAKINKHPLSADDVAKLDALVGAASPELLAVAAWPMDVVRAASGQIVGYIMPKVLDARPLFELYSPRFRVQHFPAADFRFLVHTAANIARLFAAVHKAGFICGDVNHSNVLVRESGTVAAVDCDSFQVGDGSRFPCLVGTDLFVPPELLGVALTTARRTANHDNFGLAVLVFHLLFMGRHPFAGRFIGRGEMPIERAIAEGRYAYSRHGGRSQMLPPPLTLPVAAVGARVAELFELAFDPAAKTGSRPSPESWVTALDDLRTSLSVCASVPHHHFLASAGACPWCQIEQASRLKLFGGLIRVTTAKVVDLESLWARYLALVDPGPPRPLPVLPRRQRVSVLTRFRQASSWATPTVARTRQWLSDTRRRAGDWISDLGDRIAIDRVIWVLCIAGFVWLERDKLVISLWTFAEDVAVEGLALISELAGDPYHTQLAIALFLVAGPVLSVVLSKLARSLLRIFVAAPRARAAHQTKARSAISTSPASTFAARAAWKAAAKAWQAQPPPPDVAALKTSVEAVKLRLDAVLAERETRIQAAAKVEPADIQLARLLGALRIEDAKLPGIGPARCVVLRSWGIDTAADIDAEKILEIPGFGASLTDKLVGWRQSKVDGFVPSTATTIDPLEVQRIDRQLAARRTKLMTELRERIADVERVMGPYLDIRARLWADVEKAHAARV